MVEEAAPDSKKPSVMIPAGVGCIRKHPIVLTADGSGKALVRSWPCASRTWTGSVAVMGMC